MRFYLEIGLPTKDQIINEIRRTAAANGGQPLGVSKFEAATGIRYLDWFGVYWARWGDALSEAGFEPNQLQGSYDNEHVLHKLAELTIELGRIPVRGDLKIKRRGDPSFPSWNVFSRYGTKAALIQRLSEYCRENPVFADVLNLCEQTPLDNDISPKAETTALNTLGYVYMVQHGSRREYKIGRTNNAIRREGEIAVELPEKIQPIHTIKTDDPTGVEAYWHRRFADRRKNGEWFQLSAVDVAAFKRWKRIH